jgi:hypothetical protein
VAYPGAAFPGIPHQGATGARIMKLQILSAKELMEEWGNKEELAIIKEIEDGLPCHEKVYLPPWEVRDKNGQVYELRQVEPGNIENRYKRGKINFNNLIFYRTDIDRFAMENDGTPLSGSERRELGMLRLMNKREDAAIEAAFHLGRYCGPMGGKVVKAELLEVYRTLSKDGKIFTGTNFKRIWDALPDDLKRLDGTSGPSKKLLE